MFGIGSNKNESKIMIICVVLRYNCPAQVVNISIRNEINERIAVTYDYSSVE